MTGSKTTFAGRLRCLAAAALIAFAAMGLLAASAPASSFGIENWEASVSDTRAAAHADGFTSFTLKTNSEGQPFAPTKQVTVDVPPGLVGNPRVLTECTIVLLKAFGNGCPRSAMAGFVHVELNSSDGFAGILPLFRIKPPVGIPASFAFLVANTTVVRLDAEVRSDGDYGLQVNVREANGTLGLTRSDVTLWGVPADHAGPGPLEFSLGSVSGSFPDGNTFGGPLRGPRRPFLTNPSECGVAGITRLSITNWYEPGAVFTAESAPTTVHGCEILEFNPAITAEPTLNSAATPSGLNAELEFAINESPDGRGNPPLRDASVAFPAGVAINPSAADGLGVCRDDQLNLNSKAPVTCPDNSLIGTATIVTPVLDETIPGKLFLRPMNSGDPESGEMYRLGLVLNNPTRGISVRLPGAVKVDRNTGQIEASFSDNPQLPVSKIDVDLNGGGRAMAVTPPTCGIYTAGTRLTSWGGQVKDIVTSFKLDEGPHGGPCLAGDPNKPADAADKAKLPMEIGMNAGVVKALAGSSSPFVFKLTRPDGDQEMSALDLDLPQGLLAKLAGVSRCSDAALASIGTSVGDGAKEIANPACPSNSQVGSVIVGAGAGAVPLYVRGKAYLAGPYKGAPFSIAVVVPAVAGPFDLGNSVVRSRLVVDPEDAQVHVKSDPFPTILGGVPLNLRDIRVLVDRPGFMRAPSNCRAMTLQGTVFGANGAVARPASRFQVGDCGSVPFAPRLQLRLKGGAKRNQNPALTATLTARPGDANIGDVSVTLPRSEFLDNDHIKTICTRVQFAADSCPQASIYGFARAWTPLLDQPLEGPVYLRSSNHKLPDLVAALDGEVEIDLAGRIDTGKGGGIRNTFETVPDAPVTKFVLRMQGGKKGLLVNSTNLCNATRRATVLIEGQNGKTADQRPVVENSCKKTTRKARSHRR